LKRDVLVTDRNNGTASSPEGTTGLAMILGETRSELRHHVEGTAEALDELRAAVAEETAARESTLAENNEILAGLRDVIQQVVDTVESLATTKQTTRKTGGEDTTTPPVRKRGESNGDYYKQLAAWATDNDANDPPKPKGTEFKDAYGKRVAEWMKTNVSAQAK
jgi:hypothetical protein